MNKIVFGDEHLRLSKWVCGVYKVVLNDQWFYIGSSIDLKRRLSCWKNYLSTNQLSRRIKNRSIDYLLPSVNKVNFEIIEFVCDGSNPKLREDFFIKQNFENEYCLNIIPDAVTGKGRKLPLGVTRREKKQKGQPTPKKPVAVFDMSGKFLKICESIGEARVFTGVKPDIIRKIFNGKCIRPKKYIFKPVSGSGEILEVKNTTKITAEIVNFICDNYLKEGCAKLSKTLNMRSSLVREIARGRVYKNFIRNTIVPTGTEQAKKPVLKFDLNGNFICQYPSINSAARNSNMTLSQVQRVLSGERRQSAGFVFKYANQEDDSE